MKRNAKYFINLFENIPDNKWCIGEYARPVGADTFAYCALGHCGARHNNRDTELSRALSSLFSDHNLNITSVNDGASTRVITTPEYSFVIQHNDLGDTPKERILNALVLIDNNLLKEF